jgi:magnesium transporter
MIAVYKQNDAGLAALIEPTSGCWINAINPTTEEITRLQSLGIPQDYITYPLDIDERSRFEKENGEMLIVLRIPVFQGREADIPYITVPLGIILSPDHLITVCRQDNDILRDFAAGRVRALNTAKRNRFILHLLLVTAAKYLAYLREINRVVDTLEDKLQQSTRNKELLEILKYQKSLTYFTTALKSNELMIKRLQRSDLFSKYPEDEDFLEDVLTENQQAIEMTSISSNILNSMMDAFASIISNNLNGVMKFLASVTIVLSLPTMISSFFGMNVSIPMEEHPYAFLAILGLSLLMTTSMVVVFVKRDWF